MTSVAPHDGGMGQNQAYEEVARLLFGDGLVSKANPDSADLATRKRQKTQARIGLATNVVGLAAGTAAVGESAAKYKRSRGTGKTQPFKNLSRAGKLKRISIPAAGLAGAGLLLQGANVGGDVIANRVLSREAKKDIHKSGKNCFPTSKGELIKVSGEKVEPKVRGRLKKLSAQVQKAAPIEVSKMDDDHMQVFGWASVVEKNGEPIYDLQGDYIPVDEMEKAAYGYVQKSRKGGDQHRRLDGDIPFVAGEMIESIAITPEKKAALGLPDETPTGWWVGFQIKDEDVWKDIKAGKRTGFSVHGKGVRTAV